MKEQDSPMKSGFWWLALAVGVGVVLSGVILMGITWVSIHVFKKANPFVSRQIQQVV